MFEKMINGSRIQSTEFSTKPRFVNQFYARTDARTEQLFYAAPTVSYSSISTKNSSSSIFH